MLKNILTLIISLFIIPLYAQQADLRGTLLELATYRPVASASITLDDVKIPEFSNEAGLFLFKNVSVGNHKLTVSCIGYEKFTQLIEVKRGALSPPLKLVLKPSSVSLEEVIVQTKNAGNQQLIGKIDINLRPINNSQEVLRMVPGLFIGQHAGGGKAEQIFLRGFDIDHGTDISLNADGIPVNMVSHAHGQGYADLHFIIPELIENVAFKKGTYSADKGNFSTAGWVDFRTKDVLDKSFIKTEIGQFDTYRAVGAFDLLGAKAKENNQSAYVASEYNFSNSYFDSPQHFKRFNLFGKYYGKIAPSTYLNFSASTFWSKWNHSGQIPDRAVASGLVSHYGAIDDTEGGETSRTNVNLQLLTTTQNGALIRNQFFYSNYNFELFSNFTFFLNDPVNGDQIRQYEKRNLVGYNGSYSLEHNFGGKSAELAAGINFRHDITNGSELSHTANRTDILERIKWGDVNETNLGLYITESVNLASTLKLDAGLRYDIFISKYYDRLLTENLKANAGILSPKINLYYTPNNRVQFYLNNGKSFHSNDTRVVVQEKGKNILPAAYGTDLGVNLKPFSNLFLNLAAWHLWLDQEFVYVGDAGVVEPGGKTRRQGIDLSARYQIAKNVFFDLDVNATKPRAIGEEKGKDYLPLAPVFTSIGGITVKNQSGLSGSFRYRYMGDRPANEDNSLVAKGYFINDLQLNYTKKRYVVGLSVNNVFNRKWKETQFATESRLKNETEPVEEIHFTAGSPFFTRLILTYQLK